MLSFAALALCPAPEAAVKGSAAALRLCVSQAEALPALLLPSIALHFLPVPLGLAFRALASVAAAFTVPLPLPPLLTSNLFLVSSVSICESRQVPLPCRFADFEQDVWNLYNLEFEDQMGKSTGWPSLDEVYKVNIQPTQYMSKQRNMQGVLACFWLQRLPFMVPVGIDFCPLFAVPIFSSCKAPSVAL